MKDNGVISVIVPIYNVEKYLEECIESAIRQSYRNLEIILIDDGSRDNCGAICDRYAQMDSRILVVHQKNGGAAAARNAGLRIASGEYIAFLDGDDYLEPDAYENMVEALVSNDADIVQGKMKIVYVDGTDVLDGLNEKVCFSTVEYLIRFLEDWTCALCTEKLFRRHVLSDVFFEEGHWIDDEFFTYQGVMNARKIVYIPTIVDNYRQRASSVMNTHNTIEKKLEDIFAFLEKRCRDVTGRFPELKSLYEGHYADYLLWLATSDMGTKKTIKEIKKRLIRYLAEGKALFWKKGQRKRTLRILSFLLMPAKPGESWKGGITKSGYQLFE